VIPERIFRVARIKDWPQKAARDSSHRSLDLYAVVGWLIQLASVPWLLFIRN